MATQSPYLNKVKVELEGQAASPELINDLLQITVEESLHLPAIFTMVIHNSYFAASSKAEYQPWRHENLFEIGQKVIFLSKGLKLWEGDKDNITKSDVKELNDFVFANRMMKLIK